jgi:hypothetical protein
MKLNNLSTGKKVGIALFILILLLLGIFIYKSKHAPVPPAENRSYSDTISQTSIDRNNENLKPAISAQKYIVLKRRIKDLFSKQLEYPQKKNRVSQCQFGYNLFLTSMPLYPITEFINPKKFGTHSYGGGGIKENNGSLYTCRGGFIDFAHMRTAADWTTYLTLKIITEQKDFDLPEEAGTLKLHFNNLQHLSERDIASMAQKIAFERLVWHEVASWYYHMPNHLVMEQQSTFTPEDIYSNALGTEIGKHIALRILNSTDTTLNYNEIATEEIEKQIALLNPVDEKKQSKQAYDIVDRFKQLKLPAKKRNKDVWWDSDIVFMDPRYVFKRDVDTGPAIEPWLVPHEETLGCSSFNSDTLLIPEKAENGEALNSYYQFTIKPDSSLFFSKRNGRQLHPTFGAFTTNNFEPVIANVKRQMEEKLLPGFDRRNKQDPVAQYGKVKRVLFKNL